MLNMYLVMHMFCKHVIGAIFRAKEVNVDNLLAFTKS